MTTRAVYLATAAILALGAFAAPSAQAGYVVTLEEVGSNVVATGSGPIDLTGLTFLSSGNSQAFIVPARALTITGPTILTGEDAYAPISRPANFGSGFQTFASTGSGDVVGILTISAALIVPQGYVSDGPLFDTSTYDNQTFASLGVTPGVYESTWGAGANQNFTLVIGASPVPEPSTWAMMLIGFAGLGYASCRASRKSAAVAA
jgi:hypothetical protein